MKKDRLDYSFISTITTCMSQLLSSNKYTSKRQNAATTEAMSMCFFCVVEWKEKDPFKFKYTLEEGHGNLKKKFPLFWCYTK